MRAKARGKSRGGAARASRARLFAVKGIAKHADAHLGARDVRQLDVAREALVLLRVVVLEANLQLDRLEKLALLLLGALQDLLDAGAQVGVRDLRHAAGSPGGAGAARDQDGGRGVPPSRLGLTRRSGLPLGAPSGRGRGAAPMPSERRPCRRLGCVGGRGRVGEGAAGGVPHTHAHSGQVFFFWSVREARI